MGLLCWGEVRGSVDRRRETPKSNWMQRRRKEDGSEMGLKGSLIARERPLHSGITSGLQALGEGVAELLWPTRCVLCDVPGTLLCDECRLEIPYIDPLRACAYCGQAYGKLACIGCNSFIVKHRGLAPGEHESSRGDHEETAQHETRDFRVSVDVRADHPSAERSLDQVASVFEFVDPCRKIITTFKDRKEVRLACVLAELLCSYIDLDWIRPGDTALVTIPTRKHAIRERGFDHMKEVGKELARLSGLPLVEALAPNEQGDQRGLSASNRQKNMRESFVLKEPATLLDVSASVDPLCATVSYLPPYVILVDDVLTTGATLVSAATTLKEAGVERVFGLTAARLP